MKKHIILLFSGLCFLLITLSCGKTRKQINSATEFDMSYSSEVSIPSASVSVTGPVEFTSPDIPTTSSVKFASEGTTQDLIDEIKMSKFTITNTNANGNLDFLKSLTIFIVADGLTDVVVANKDNIPPGSKTVEADMTGANIKTHIFKDKVKIRVKLTATTVPGADQKIKVEETVHVKGKKL